MGASRPQRSQALPEQERRLIVCGTQFCDGRVVFGDPVWALRNCVAFNEPLFCLGLGGLIMVPVTTVWHTKTTWMVIVFLLDLSSLLSARALAQVYVGFLLGPLRDPGLYLCGEQICSCQLRLHPL